jgi:hypothetical protein
MVQASLSDQQTTAQITQKALANRSLFQASWKSLLGFLAVLFGALTASIQAFDQGELRAGVNSLARSAEVLAAAARGGSAEHSQDGNPNGGGDSVSRRMS